MQRGVAQATASFARKEAPVVWVGLLERKHAVHGGAHGHGNGRRLEKEGGEVVEEPEGHQNGHPKEEDVVGPVEGAVHGQRDAADRG